MDINPSGLNGATGTHELQSAATTNLTSAYASQAKLTGGYLRNRAASEKYFKLYDKATAPVVASDTPLITIGIPAAGTVPLAQVLGAYGLHMTLGIAYAITGAYVKTDATAVAAADVDVNLVYAT